MGGDEAYGLRSAVGVSPRAARCDDGIASLDDMTTGPGGFMTRLRIACVLVALAVGLPQTLSAADAYTDETAFLNAVAGLGLCTAAEGFEDDAAWGGARSTIPGGTHTLSSVTNLGLTWQPRVPTGGMTTSQGPARSGRWGGYELPHGEPPAVTDGFRVTSAGGPLVAFGGWLETNTFGARVNLVLDDATVVDFSGDNLLDFSHRFFGVVEPLGFSAVEVVETEADDELLFVFGDDFIAGWVSCPDALPFADGFESGDTDRWSGAAP
jgi:hypothetical protein